MLITLIAQRRAKKKVNLENEKTIKAFGNDTAKLRAKKHTILVY